MGQSQTFLFLVLSTLVAVYILQEHCLWVILQFRCANSGIPFRIGLGIGLVVGLRIGLGFGLGLGVRIQIGSYIAHSK